MRVVKASRGLGVALALVLTGCTNATGPLPDLPAPTLSPGQSRPAVASGTAEVALRVLVLDDGRSWSRALVERLRVEGIPYTRIGLQGRRRPLTRDALATRDDRGVHGRYAAIIGPSLRSRLLSSAERDAIGAYQAAFAVRFVETASWDEIATRAPAYDVDDDSMDPDRLPPRFEGPIDGAQATLTPRALAGPFSYLRPTVAIDPGTNHTAALLTPNPTIGSGGTFTPLLTMPLPGTQIQGALIGTDVRAGRERLIIALDGDPSHQHVKLLAHGILRWATRDASTSHFRSYFSVHADDILLPNTQWSVAGNCEIGRNCPPEIPRTGPDATVRMTPEDVTALVAWQRRSGVKVDMALNGAGAAQYAQSHGGSDPLADRLVAETGELRWISHTFTHAFLGCQQVLEPDDWRCVTDERGAIVWQPREVLAREVTTNQRFMAKLGLRNYSPDELVTGEHSGLRKPPQQPEDNPHLAPVLTRAGIAWVASDASQEHSPRRIGSATTVPRHPIDLDYNTPTAPQVVSLFNRRNVDKAHGGSGECDPDPKTDCVPPLDLARGFTEVIVPMEAGKMVDHMITDDPRPHFVHQSNLASERLLYPMLDAALQRRAAAYSDTVPLLNPTMAEAGRAVLDRDRWAADQPLIDATVSGQRLRVTNRGSRTVRVPVSLPEGSATVTAERAVGGFGAAYAGQRSAWVEVAPGGTAEFEVPTVTGFPTEVSWPPPAAG